MYKIKYKTRKSLNREDLSNDLFDEKILPNEYHYEKMAVNAMLTLGRTEQKKIHATMKRQLEKKEEITLMYDKKGNTVGVLLTKNKKPLAVLRVWELVKETPEEDL